MRDFQFPGRSAAYGERGMAATSHPQATLAALDVLRGGGNAVDAAVAASALLGVVEPHMSGIGGDLFALVGGASGRVFALEAAGPAPAAASLERLRAAGLADIPQTSPHAVTVPGYVAGIEALVERFGTRTLDELLQPAITAAEEGFLVTPRVAWDWGRAEPLLRRNAACRAIHLPRDRAPRPGERHALPLLGRTLRRIAGLGASAFYAGEAAEAMAATLRAAGGVHAPGDFAAYRPRWVEPIRTAFNGFEVLECPPPGQGVVALLMLNLLEALGVGAQDPDGAARFHLEAEATKLAFALRDRHVADPLLAEVPVNRLLDPGFARDLARRVDPARVGAPVPPLLDPHPDTTYLTVVDRDRTVCSFISSLYDGFGSGIACPASGVLFQSRGTGFRLDPAHPNALAPNKRPMHTIIPGMVLLDGRPFLGFGVMGGDYQPVGHAHLLTDVLAHGRDPQAALEVPRATAYPQGLTVERSLRPEVVEALAGLGHDVRQAERPLGSGQAILIDHAAGVLVGGTDPRKDGMALGF